MDDIGIDMNTIKEHSDSHDNLERTELLWEKRIEEVIYKWRKHCIEQSRKHGIKARTLKRKYQLITIPSILIPVVISGFSQLLQNHPLITSGCMVLVSISSGVSGFLNLGKLTEANFHAEGLYADLALNIEQEICKPKKNRLACDVYLERIRSAISKIYLNSPNL